VTISFSVKTLFHGVKLEYCILWDVSTWRAYFRDIAMTYIKCISFLHCESLNVTKSSGSGGDDDDDDDDDSGLRNNQ